MRQRSSDRREGWMLEVVSGSKRRIKPPGRSEAVASVAASRPSLLELIIAVAVMMVQQAAFIPVPALVAGSSVDPSTLGGAPNPFNTAAVAANGLAVGVLCLIHRRKVWSVVRGNWTSVLLA